MRLPRVRFDARPRPVASMLIARVTKWECARAGHRPMRIPSGTVCASCGHTWSHA